MSYGKTAEKIMNKNSKLCNSLRSESTLAGSDRASDSGVAALEFGLVAPIFLMLAVGIMVYGIYLTSWIAVVEAASDAARASVAGITNDCTNYPTGCRQYLATQQWNADIAAYSPLLSASNTTAPTYTINGNLVTLTASYSFTSLGFASLSKLLPITIANPSFSVVLSNGGY